MTFLAIFLHESACVAFDLSFHFSTCVPLVFYLCSLVFTCVPICVHLCSLVSLPVFICVLLVFISVLLVLISVLLVFICVVFLLVWCFRPDHLKKGKCVGNKNLILLKNVDCPGLDPMFCNNLHFLRGMF